MRRWIIASAGVLALATCGFAIAMGIGPKSAKLVAGTFNATTASQTFTRTCTTTDGKTIAVSHGVYTGSAVDDVDLAGPITIAANSTINTTDGIGVVTGRLKIDVASGEDTTAHFDAVYDHGTLAGLARGHAHDPRVRLLGNLSAGFSTAGGFTGGKIGGGTSGGSAVELGPGHCAPNRPVHQTSEARGTVSAASTTSITVAGLTCNVPAALSVRVAALALGSFARIKCELVGTTNTLVRLETKHR
jgi:hypothetical protein